jgi:hypothetical protein
MGKRVMIGVLAVVGLMAMWWAEAEAATCLQYRTIGGSSVCSKWSTKGVRLELTFKEQCTVEGAPANCSAVADAATSDSIAFCTNPAAPLGPPVRIACNQPVTFSGASGECVPKHEQDVTGTGGVGHEHHGCTATFDLAPNLAGCNTCCATAGLGACLDVTPVEMDTEVTVFVPFGESESAAAQTGQCSPDSSSCTFEEHCSINPKKIAFNEVRPYQCNLQCAGAGCVVVVPD